MGRAGIGGVRAAWSVGRNGPSRHQVTTPARRPIARPSTYPTACANRASICGSTWASARTGRGAPERKEPGRPVGAALPRGRDGRAQAQGQHLEIEVVNFWPNRIIGDQFLPPKKRFTRTNIRNLTKETPLMESGLLGPVRILSAE